MQTTSIEHFISVQPHEAEIFIPLAVRAEKPSLRSVVKEGTAG